MRGRVMGFVQTAFAGSQILGLPAGLFLSNHWGWHAPFLMIVAVSIAVGIVIAAKLKPINAHLAIQRENSAVRHLIATVSTPRYLFAFSATALLSVGGFMLMPFGSAFTVHNLDIDIEKLPIIYLISGIASILIGPTVGRLADRFGNLPTFAFGSTVSIVMAIIYTNMTVSPLWVVILVNALMFVGVFSRMIPSQALMSAIPDPASRGSFMAISSSMQQIAGGLASIVAGLVVLQRADGYLQHFNVLGYVLAATAIIALVMMSRINKMVMEKPRVQEPAAKRSA